MSQVACSVHALQSALLITASVVGLMLVHWPPVDPSALKPLPDFSIEDNTLKKKSTKFQRRVEDGDATLQLSLARSLKVGEASYSSLLARAAETK